MTYTLPRVFAVLATPDADADVFSFQSSRLGDKVNDERERKRRETEGAEICIGAPAGSKST